MGKSIRTDKNAMALYVRVVENGSFSKTAQREGVPVSTVSRKVMDLEAALGVRLLERSTRRLRMTPIGEDYFEHCRRGLTEFEAADSLVGDRHSEMSGRVRISVPPTMSDVIVLPLVNAFQKRHPKVAVHCLVTERFIDHIADGIDLSLRVGTLQDSNLVANVVTRHRPRLVASARWIARHRRALREPAAAEAGVEVAFARWERPLRWELQSGTQRIVLQPQPRLVLNDYAGVLCAVLEGAGVSELPSFLCAPALADGRLVEALPAWRFASLPVATVVASNRHLSPAVKAFREFCVAWFAKAPMAPPD